MYELTHHEDKYDLRYRLRDKFTAPATAPEVPPVSRSPTAHASSAEAKAESTLQSESQSRGNRSEVHDGSAASGKARDAIGGGGFLLVTSSNVVLCEGRVLQLYVFSGEKVRYPRKGGEGSENLGHICCAFLA